MTLEDRALAAYVLAMPPSVATQGGHDAAFAVAAALVHGFAMDQATALSVMRQWNALRATPPWTERELGHKIASAATAPSRRGRGYLVRADEGEQPKRQQDAGVAPEPRGPDRPRIPLYDPEAAERYASGCRYPITLDWLAARSPVPVAAVAKQGRETAETFLGALYRPGERVLVFTDFRSQGDFCWTVGGGGARLPRQREVDPEPSRLPSGGADGVWFLIQPVTGQWTIQAGGDGARYGRRHGGCVTRWPYLLLESDTAPKAVWLRCLVQLPLAICALYTSGGRSVHALVRVDCESKADYDAARDVLRSVLPVLGADPAATTGVRLSRLPGCRRGDRLQRLVWLDPDPTGCGRILDRVRS